MKKVDALLYALITSLVVSIWYFEYTENMFTNSSIYNYLQWKTQGNEVRIEMEPIPVEIERIPVEVEPIPAEVEPIPAEVEPIPVEVQPIPVETEPIPVETEPIPVETEPIPVETEPIPVETEPIPVKTEHILVELEPIPNITNIIFIDTTCVLNDTSNSELGLSLTKRQACAVESAAKMNPDCNVYVLYTCPINGKLEDISNHVRALFLYPNIKLWKLNITRHLADTPLANWDFMKAISSSQWPIEHASHVLRFVTLWKYGGTYLDLDVIVFKPLSELGINYVAKESAEDLGIAVMNFAYESMGHEAVQNCINEMLNDFRGDIWTHNGVRVLNTAFLKLCNVSKVSEMSAEKCNGFKVLPTKEFYAISYSTWNHFFNGDESENVMNTIKDSYGVHMWNRLSKNTNVTVGSKQPYNLIAETSCPSVHSMSGEYF